MADTKQQIDELSRKIAGLQAQMGELCGEVAELNMVMAPFMARYQQMIWPYYESLAKTQREIADLHAIRGNKDAVSAGEARSPLDRFFDDPSVQEQYDRAWGKKNSVRQDVAASIEPASEDLKRLYTEVIGYLHPELVDEPTERERRRQLMVKVDEAYLRRDQPSLDSIAEMYRVRSHLSGRAPDDVVQYLRDRVTLLEVAIGRIEGQKFDLRHGLLAKIKTSAEQLWANEKRDLLSELSQEIQRNLSEARAELDTLRGDD